MNSLFRSFRQSLLPIPLCLAALVGCAGLIYQSPSRSFDHDVHVDSLAEKGLGCLDCHHFSELAEREFPQLFEESEAALFPEQGGACHFCHVDEATRDPKAPQQCLSCHSDMDAIRPPTHLNDWSRQHGLEARNAGPSCVACHNRQAFCTDCHTRRDSIQQVVHPRPYRYFHGIEAQADPAACNACHIANFCLDCHSGRRRY